MPPVISNETAATEPQVATIDYQKINGEWYCFGEKLSEINKKEPAEYLEQLVRALDALEQGQAIQTMVYSDNYRLVSNFRKDSAGRIINDAFSGDSQLLNAFSNQSVNQPTLQNGVLMVNHQYLEQQAISSFASQSGLQVEFYSTEIPSDASFPKFDLPANVFQSTEAQDLEFELGVDTPLPTAREARPIEEPSPRELPKAEPQAEDANTSEDTSRLTTEEKKSSPEPAPRSQPELAINPLEVRPTPSAESLPITSSVLTSLAKETTPQPATTITLQAEPKIITNTQENTKEPAFAPRTPSITEKKSQMFEDERAREVITPSRASIPTKESSDQPTQNQESKTSNPQIAASNSTPAPTVTITEQILVPTEQLREPPTHQATTVITIEDRSTHQETRTNSTEALSRSQTVVMPEEKLITTPLLTEAPFTQESKAQYPSSSIERPTAQEQIVKSEIATTSDSSMLRSENVASRLDQHPLIEPSPDFVPQMIVDKSELLAQQREITEDPLANYSAILLPETDLPITNLIESELKSDIPGVAIYSVEEPVTSPPESTENPLQEHLVSEIENTTTFKTEQSNLTLEAETPPAIQADNQGIDAPSSPISEQIESSEEAMFATTSADPSENLPTATSIDGAGAQDTAQIPSSLIDLQNLGQLDSEIDALQQPEATQDDSVETEVEKSELAIKLSAHAETTIVELVANPSITSYQVIAELLTIDCQNSSSAIIPAELMMEIFSESLQAEIDKSLDASDITEQLTTLLSDLTIDQTPEALQKTLASLMAELEILQIPEITTKTAALAASLTALAEIITELEGTPKENDPQERALLIKGLENLMDIKLQLVEQIARANCTSEDSPTQPLKKKTLELLLHLVQRETETTQSILLDGMSALTARTEQAPKTNLMYQKILQRARQLLLKKIASQKNIELEELWMMIQLLLSLTEEETEHEEELLAVLRPAPKNTTNQKKTNKFPQKISNKQIIYRSLTLFNKHLAKKISDRRSVGEHFNSTNNDLLW